MQDTRAYLHELQKLTNDASIIKKDELLKRLSDLFFLTAAEQSGDDTAIFGSVMKRIAYEVEVEARARLAERFSKSKQTPHDLVRRLAGDEIAVARSELENRHI